MGTFHETVVDFLRRDYRRDITLLDKALARDGSPSAGLTREVPPSVLTGDPFSLPPSECIAVFGLNPKCLGIDTVAANSDVLISKRLIDAGKIDEYIEQRASYFETGDAQYNAVHFNRLIERVQLGLLGQSVVSKERFGKQAGMFDLLPWWSVNTDNLDANRCSDTLEPLRAWKDVVGAMIAEKRPRAIIVNGSSFRRWTSTLFGAELEPFTYDGGKGRLFKAYHGRRDDGTPLLVHGQVRAQRGPQSLAQYRSMVAAWRNQTEVPNFADLV